MNSVTAHDYAWIRTSPLFALMTEWGYSLTLVRGSTPREVLDAMGAEPCGTGEGVAGLIDANQAHESDDHWDESYVAGAAGVRGERGDWTLVLGFDWGLGLSEACAEGLSRGGRVVAHSKNGGKPIDLFHWFEDGELRTTFESPRRREGSTPDDLIPLLRDVGLPLSLEGEYDDSAPDVDRKAAVLALAERLTGVRVTESLLAEASYELGLVPDESTQSKCFDAAKPQQPR
ncbi:DUF6461 domain-containing protein [Streptomyces althioticus]|uniref:DUF6461 domain-containing protein n=1 Tax=Streptomyces althioticus TaxID=83380 RepID=UPI0033D0D6E5